MTAKAATQPRLYKQCEQFVMNFFRTFEDEPQKLKAFKALFLRNKKSNNNVLESQMKLVELLQNRPELVRKLNQLVPDEFKVLEYESKDNLQDEDEEMDIQDIFAELNKRRPQKVQDLITFLQELKSKQNENNNDVLRERIKNIFQDEPKLYRAFMKQFGSSFAPKNNEIEEEFDQNSQGQFINNENLADADNKKKPRVKMTRIEKITAMKRNQVQKGFRRKEIENRITQITVTNERREISEVVLPQTLRNEMYLFEYLQKNVEPETYDELMKIIHLYNKCCLSSNEVFILAKPIFEGNETYFSFFQEIVSLREPMRRKNTKLFKPLADIDFKKEFNCERVGSYNKIPEFFPYAKRTLHPHYSDNLSVLNQNWVSVPTGSETNFTIHTRNTYEVNLFVAEDERYEFDTALYCYDMAVRWLKMLDTMDSDEKKSQLVDKILKLKVIQKVYGNNSEILDLFKKNQLQSSVIKIVLERIQSKAQEIRETKQNQAKKKWQDVSRQNFHRSLDHRSFYFKQSEKKITSHKSFVPEALSRHKELNIIGDFQKSDQYWNVLDTFQGISNGLSCIHQKPDNLAVMIKEKQLDTRKNLPIYQLLFSDKQIVQDIFDLLFLKTQFFHATLTEKEKISRYLKIFLTELLNLPSKAENVYDSPVDQATLLKTVLGIESKIFMKSFTFVASKENGDQTSKETDKTMPIEEQAVEKEKTKKSGMEIEGQEPKGPRGRGGKAKEVKANQNEEEGGESEDEMKLDSASEEQTSIKNMEYTDKLQDKDGLFVPSVQKGQAIFYGTQHVYCLIRYYFTLYERFAKAREVAFKFEDNAKTRLLSQEEKDALSKERYDNFKLILSSLIRGNLDNEKYEDLLRSLFGNKAYLMFYIDKIIYSIIVTLQKVYGDDITLRTLNLFTESELLMKNSDRNQNKNGQPRGKNQPEAVYLAQLNHLTLKYINNIQSTTLFRFLYNSETQLVTINLFEWPYKDWKEKVLEGVASYSEAYLSSKSLGNCLKTSKSPVFLKKNKEMNRKKSLANSEQIQIHQTHNIEWKYLPNTQKLVTDQIHQEETLFIAKNKTESSENMMKNILSQYIRQKRFRAWQKKVLKS